MEFQGYLQMGSEGDSVAELQDVLNQLGFDSGTPDGVFGDKTGEAVTAFQNSYGMYDDGVVGEAVVDAINHALEGPRPHLAAETLQRGKRGDAVAVLQDVLNSLGYDAGNPDGIFGGGTRKAVVSFQEDLELTADGIVGPNTVDALCRALREAEAADAEAEEADFSV